ncbi:hypothetical protein [Proteus terrae]|uniref:hypothetical protein n=1 Tax=Proteus terrae TaxID=1574161 RepID=UPI0028890B30|nr:hypothetical protein [Proteus terrae]
MSKVTFCPHHIIDIKEDITPEVIEKFFINPLIDFLNSAFENKLTVYISQTLMTEFENTHPWELINDPKWGKWIRDWYNLLKPLLSKAEIIKHPILDGESQACCKGLTARINNIFNSFLDEFATHSLPNNANEEAIFIPTPWCANFDNFITVKNLGELKLAKYTWYKMYPLNLPCQGEIPFVPPETWRRSAVVSRGNAPGYGYMDSSRREWIWDSLHDNHWDVQDPGGGRDNYKNVSPEGKILGRD